jgi:hypothetical protein
MDEVGNEVDAITRSLVMYVYNPLSIGEVKSRSWIVLEA